MTNHLQGQHNQLLNQEYKNQSLPVNERVSILLKQMTLEEKIAQMLCVWRKRVECLLDSDKISPEKIQKQKCEFVKL